MAHWMFLVFAIVTEVAGNGRLYNQPAQGVRGNSLTGCIGGSGEAHPWHFKMNRKSPPNNKINHASTLRLQK